MTNLVKLTAGRVELPSLGRQHGLDGSPDILQQGLEAYQDLKLDLTLQTLPLSQRREVGAFLRRFGRVLCRILFPQDELAQLDRRRPLLLQTDAHWAALPWELLHDGERWLALEQGLIRLVPGLPAAEKPTAATLGVLAVTANPLALGMAGEPGAMARPPRSRFISVIDSALDCQGGATAGTVYRPLEHASWEEFAAALELRPHLLLWSGFSNEQGWYFEAAHGEAYRADPGRLAALLRQAAARGLQGLILNDSLGLHDPFAAARQARLWLEAGVPALIRIEGCHARVREQDYLRTLARPPAGGAALFASHLAAVRRLYRRFEEGWDWSYFRFYLLGEIAGQPSTGVEEASAPPLVRHGRPDAAGAPPAKEAPPFEVTEAPPAFRRRRRVFGRAVELHELLRGILPTQVPSSPLVFLTGPAGSGKTVLVLEAARRAHRRFGGVVYLERRDLLPPREEESPLPAPPIGHLAPQHELLGALARHLELHEILAEPPGEWEAALRAHLETGEPRLIIVDRLERHAGYEGFCDAARRFPPRSRVVLVGRHPPPLLPGFRVVLPPLDEDRLRVVFGEEFVERLQAHPQRERLAALCGRDLLAARLLRRLEPWPDLPPLATGAAGASSDEGLLEIALEAVLAGLDEPSRQVLPALVLLTGLVHHEVLAQVSGSEGRPLQEALTTLQWAGLIEAHDGDRYFALPPRLLAPVGQRLITRDIFDRLAPRLVRSYQGFLASVGEALHLKEGNGHALPHPPLLAWVEVPRDTASAAEHGLFHRLGAERVNLAELGTILAEESQLDELGRLAQEMRRLDALPGLRDVAARLGRSLLAAARSRRDEVGQGRALNVIGHALIAGGRIAEAAQALEGALEILSHGRGWEVLFETYLLLSRCRVLLGNPHAAGNLLASAVELAYQLGDGGYLVEALTALSVVWAERGEALEQGEQFLPQAITYLEGRGQIRLAGRVRRLLAGVYLRAARFDAAEAALGPALNVFIEADDALEAGLTQFLLAECLIRQNRPEAAWGALLDAKRRVEGSAGEAVREEARVLTLISRWYETHRRYPEALRGYLQVRRLNEALGDREGVLRTLDILGGLYFQMGEQAQSTRCYEERLHLQSAVGAGAHA